MLHPGLEHRACCTQSGPLSFQNLCGKTDGPAWCQDNLSPVKRICVFEHSVMTNFNCACPAIQRGQGSSFLSEGSPWFTACMSEQRRFWRDCADAQAHLNLEGGGGLMSRYGKFTPLALWPVGGGFPEIQYNTEIADQWTTRVMHLYQSDYCNDPKWASSSKFVSSSIPSWQILTAHAQPFRGARDLAFCLKVPLDSLLVWASSGGSGESVGMRRLAWTFAARIGDKYQIRLTRSKY